MSSALAHSLWLLLHVLGAKEVEDLRLAKHKAVHDVVHFRWYHSVVSQLRVLLAHIPALQPIFTAEVARTAGPSEAQVLVTRRHALIHSFALHLFLQLLSGEQRVF